MSFPSSTHGADAASSLATHGFWKSAWPLLAEAGWLTLVCLIAVALASASDLGRPGSGYPGYVFSAVVAGAMMLYHRSVARRAVCFVALLLALIGIHSEKVAHDNFRGWIARTQMKQMQKIFEQLAERSAKSEESQPNAIP